MALKIVHINCLVALAVLCSAVSGSAEDRVAKLLLGDGPFEVVGDNGIFGFVVTRSETTTTVKFKPCYGPPFDIETQRLKRTTIDCAQGPSPDTYPLQVRCGDMNELRSAQTKASSDDIAIGTIYEVHDDVISAINKASSKEINAAFADVSEFRACGDWTVGYTATGAAAVTIVPVPLENQINIDELYRGAN
ncbi:hypothetical protein LH464_18360 [Neorhizobium sp. T786]|uniref:hypothetical protein n=1 Tax=Pseudorhizobium xiangyangii TaxID=2883104 RepID=UPI001D001890|nr:hypothetical protein [Neorhizobium xiangyangii]MCB5204434.1 hypothetical protein [Neorhizobium xiangyangii]